MMMQNSWYPLCFESKAKYLSWKEARDYAHEVASICDDCNKSYSEEMKRQGRCNPTEAIYNSTNSRKSCKLKIIQKFT